MIGRMDRRGTLFKKERKPNGRGGHFFEIVELSEVWFSYSDLGLETIVRLEQFKKEATGTIYIRFDDSINSDHYIEEKSFRFDFVNVRPIGKSQFLEISVRKESIT